MNRRTLLTVFGSSLGLFGAGCLNREPEESDDEHACTREKWSVILYNESAKSKTMTVTITDFADQTVFADTIELDPKTDQFTGVELGTEVYYERSYTFEADLSEGEEASTETVVKCGNVYIFVTESGEVNIRDDSHVGD
jgi:hypothetical protein